MATKKNYIAAEPAPQEAEEAAKAETAPKEAEQEAAPEAVPEVKEPVYTAAEFAAAASKVFGKGTSPDLVRAAFRVAGITSATVKEAKELVEKFANREVKE